MNALLRNWKKLAKLWEIIQFIRHHEDELKGYLVAIVKELIKFNKVLKELAERTSTKFDDELTETIDKYLDGAIKYLGD